MNKFVIFLPSTLDYEAVEACDLLVKMFWKLLSDLRLLSKSKILSSKKIGTPAVGSQEPGYLQFRSHCLRLDGYQVACDNVPALPVLFNPLEKLSCNSGHWHGLPWLLHMFFSMHFSFWICFCQSRTNSSLTQNSRPAAQLFDSMTCNLNLAEYFIRFEDIFLNLETGEKQRGRDLVNNNLKHLQGFVFELTCSNNVIGPFLIANNEIT